MTVQVRRESDFVVLDSAGERMFLSAESFADFVRRAKVGEFDRKFDPTTGSFTVPTPVLWGHQDPDPAAGDGS